MVRYKLHHLGVLCADLAISARFYVDVLEHQVLNEIVGRERNVVYVGSGSELMLELIGRPFEPHEVEYMKKRRAGFHHLAFEVDDVDQAFAELYERGVAIAWTPKEGRGMRHCGVYDDCGVLIEILQEREAWPRPKIDFDVPYLLHHFDIFSDDWQRTKNFYAKHFGFRSVFEYVYDAGGAFIYLADSFFDVERRQAMIEVIGPPYEEAREFVFAEKYGTGMDHIGYLVKDVEGAYEAALARGSREFVRPYSDYGTTMCWVQDADGEDLELMLAVPKEKLREAFLVGRPYRPHR